LADDLQPRAVQQASQPLAQKDVIVRQDHPGAARINTTIIIPDLAECYGDGLTGSNLTTGASWERPTTS